MNDASNSSNSLPLLSSWTLTLLASISSYHFPFPTWYLAWLSVITLVLIVLAVQTRVWQLNRWPCHSVSQSVTHWVRFLILTIRVTLETCDLWDIKSEWWEDLTWPTKRQWQRQRQRQWQWQRQIYLENTLKERS